MNTRRLLAAGGLLGLLLGLPAVSRPQATSDELGQLRQEVDTLKAGQKAIHSELQEIKTLLTARRQERSPVRDLDLTLGVAETFTLGAPQAALTLVEFSDYQCPFCARHVRETLPKIAQDYIATGKLRYVVRDFPLDSIHKLARKAAEAFWCANEQGKAGEMHARLFAHQQRLQPEELAEHAQAVGLDVLAFQACLDSGKYSATIDASLKEGEKVGVTGTPAFVLGYTQASGAEVKAVKFLSGAQPFDAFKEHIDRLLERNN